MLNDDVIAIIKSYAGITPLDVADAVRELKREGVVVETFKMRDLAKLCFIIQHKFEKKERNTEWMVPKVIQAELKYDFMDYGRNLYLLAFKVLGFKYNLNVVLCPHSNCTCLPFTIPFTIFGKRLSQFRWCKLLKRIYEKETGNYCQLMALRNSRYRQTKMELRVMRPLF